MRYAIARYQKDQRELAYRIYVSDTLKLISENTAKLSAGGYMKERYYDVINRTRSKYDDMSGDEIAAEIIKRAGLVVK